MTTTGVELNGGDTVTKFAVGDKVTVLTGSVIASCESTSVAKGDILYVGSATTGIKVSMLLNCCN